MTHEAAFKTVFRAKKGTKRRSRHLVSVLMCYLRYFDRIPKKWIFSRKLLRVIQVHELESRERVMTEEIHIAGSTALGAFVVDINFIWLCLLSWAYLVLVNILAYKRLQRIHPSRKLQRMNVKRKRNAFLNMWNYFNIAVLWLDISVIAYCYARSGNCVLIYESETSYTNGSAVLIINIAICYVAQIFNFSLHKDEYMKITNFLSTAFHDEVSRLIYRDVATVKWMANCGHWKSNSNGSRDFVSTHTEVFYLF